MGHLIFILLHIAAILFGFVFLFFTIPLHLIYAVMRRKPQTVVVQVPADDGDVGAVVDPAAARATKVRALLYIVVPVLLFLGLGYAASLVNG